MAQPSVETADAAQAFVEELLYASLAFTDFLAYLLEEAPETASSRNETTIELIVGACRPALAAASADECRAATALVHAIRDRVFEILCDDARSLLEGATSAAVPAAPRRDYDRRRGDTPSA
jgi:hypothetical protein